MMDEVSQESTVEDDPFHSSEKTPSILGISRSWTAMLTQKRSQISTDWPPLTKLPHQKMTGDV